MRVKKYLGVCVLNIEGGLCLFYIESLSLGEILRNMATSSMLNDWCKLAGPHGKYIVHHQRVGNANIPLYNTQKVAEEKVQWLKT